MPVIVRIVNGKPRIVEKGRGGKFKIAKGRGGKAVDSGGKGKSRKELIKQVQAINLSQRRKAGKSAPPKPRSGRRR